MNLNSELNKNIVKYTKNDLNNINNSNTIVNYSCFCSKCFYTIDKILYILPCCHLVHEKCFNDYILKCQYKKFDLNKLNQQYQVHLNCPQCNKIIETVLSENKINMKKKYYQYKIDLKSVRIDNSANINYMTLPLSIVKFTTFMNKLISVYTDKELISTIEYALNSFNVKINIIDNTNKNPIEIKNNRVYWTNKDDKDKLIIISNHAHYLDSLIIYYLFRCGFVSSDFINQTDIGRIIATKLKLLIFKRGVDTNMVEKIKKYLDEQKKIVIFPEGAFANNETIIRFRTGAFYVGETICPIVIKYDNIVYDDDFKKMLLKIITQNEINVTVYINDFFYPPFDDFKIEQIRDHMASIGNLKKSRVSNKSLRE